MTDNARLFDRCVEAASTVRVLTPDQVTRAVIQTIIDHTGSPRTVDELTRVLEGEV